MKLWGSRFCANARYQATCGTSKIFILPLYLQVEERTPPLLDAEDGPSSVEDDPPRDERDEVKDDPPRDESVMDLIWKHSLPTNEGHLILLCGTLLPHIVEDLNQQEKFVKFLFSQAWIRFQTAKDLHFTNCAGKLFCSSFTMHCCIAPHSRCIVAQ